MLLAIDTSTAWAGICLYDRDRDEVVHEAVWRTGTGHCEQLIPTIEAALRQQRLTPAALSAVAVAVGPGTFNGVRVAVATAKLLARARGIPLVGVDTLEIYANQFGGDDVLVRPMLGAARGEAATALFGRRAGVVERIEEDRIAAPATLFIEPLERALFTGELTPEWRAAVAGLGPLARAATPSEAVRRPSALAAIALARLARDEADDVAALQPIYLRPPHITRAKR